MVGIIFVEIIDCLLKGNHTLYAECLIKCQIGFVGNAIWGGGVNNILIECIYGIIVVKKMLGNLLKVGVETNAEKALLGLNLLNKFYSVNI